jgi:hypothetical protein
MLHNKARQWGKTIAPRWVGAARGYFMTLELPAFLAKPGSQMRRNARRSGVRNAA